MVPPGVLGVGATRGTIITGDSGDCTCNYLNICIMNIIDTLENLVEEEGVRTTERIVYAAAGGWLVRSAFSGGLGSLIKGAAGAALLYRAATGRWPSRSLLERTPQSTTLQPASVRVGDQVVHADGTSGDALPAL
jgi:hypothetical protein